MKIFQKLGLFCTGSNRAKIYLQQMILQGFLPAEVLYLNQPGNILNEKKARRKGNLLTAESLAWIQSEYQLDLKQTLPELCQSYQIPIQEISTLNPNTEEIIKAVEKSQVDVFIFAARGILKPPLLNIGKRFLHVHPGDLPKYKGSTTLYYSLLKEGRCAASAFFLDAGLDTGLVIKTRYFEPPSDRRLIDHFYDPYFRSLLLLDVLQDYHHSGVFNANKQDGEGETYHIIHPVLKHMAILGHSLPQA